MKSDWVEINLGEITSAPHGSIKTGPFGTALKASEYSPDGVPLISVGEVGEGSLRVHAKTPRVGREVVERLSQYLLRADDIVIARKGAIDRSARVKATEEGYFLGSDGLRVRLPKSVSARFIAYQFLDPRVRAWLRQHAGGSTMPSMNQSILERVPLLLPPLDEQRRIAGVLGALDDLIEVNRGLVTDLRDLTRAAFDRLQGGATRSTTLGELITLQYGKALPATQRRTGRYPVVSSAGIVDSHDIGLVEGPGVVVGRKGTVGSVTWVDSNFFPIDTAFYVESKLPLLYVYWLLKSQDLASMNTDSAVPGLNRENALSLCVDRPDDEAIGEFVTSASPLWSAARDLEAEMGELASTRDELLPLLMSGRVRVAEVVVA